MGSSWVFFWEDLFSQSRRGQGWVVEEGGEGGWCQTLTLSCAHGKYLIRMGSGSSFWSSSSCRKPLQVQRRSRARTRVAAAAAQSGESDTTPQGGVPTPQSEAPRVPSQETQTPRRCSVDPKRWNDHRKQDLDMKLEGLVPWRDKVLGHLVAARLDVRQVVNGRDTQFSSR